jgi:hypothetical protein
MKVLAVSLIVREMADFLEAVCVHFEEARLHICSFFRQNNAMDIEASAEILRSLAAACPGSRLRMQRPTFLQGAYRRELYRFFDKGADQSGDFYDAGK